MPQGDWLPMGVFVAAQDQTQAAVSTMFVQLALNKEGFLAGTYYNAATDKTHTLEGMVDKQTQQAIWKLSENASSPVMSTQLYNLTQDVVPVRVYFPERKTSQSWLLIRLDETK